MFQQWRRAKERVPDALLLFRMGDFYEMFGEDAQRAAAILDLALTSRECGQGRRIPMCGLPWHSLDRYLPRLLESGVKAAICEQTSDPKASAGLVDRDITRIVTAGTVVEDYLLEGRSANYLAAVAAAPSGKGLWGLAWIDVSTGEFRAAEVRGGPELVREELRRLGPAECVAEPPVVEELDLERGLANGVASIPVRSIGVASLDPPEEVLTRHFGVATLHAFGLEDRPAAVEAAAVALRYLRETRLALAGHVRQISVREAESVLVLDSATQRNLELVRPIRGEGTGGTLLECLDRTRTLPGGRMLRRWLLEPLRAPDAIDARLEAVAWFVAQPIARHDVRSVLGAVRDLERLTAKVTTATAGPRDLVAIRLTLAAIPGLRSVVEATDAALLSSLVADLDPMSDVLDLLERALSEEPPGLLRDGGVIRHGYNAELDGYRDLASGGKNWIAELEAAERAKSGIPSLKVGFNSVFGYYVEVTHAHSGKVPEHYIRKQTLRNAERYITPELKEMEEKILAAEERIAALEAELFAAVRDAVAEQAGRLLSTATALAALDVLAALAEVAAERGYTRPTVDDTTSLHIVDGRHPVVESILGSGAFVPNSVTLDTDELQIAIVTGPNMAGKSTYLRQTALIALMAQMGSFVPAAEARIGVVDRIFTRVGAHDDLAGGQSTFMVEMSETAYILRNATARSLVILDEIGRGTSTYDGLSIAWAVTEYIHESIGARTLFATHYHQLNALEGLLERVRNFRVLVREEGDHMVFLRRIAEGGTDRSYGIQVGRLAGLPQPVVERAKQVLWSIEAERIGPDISVREVRPAALSPAPALPPPGQLPLFDSEPPDPRVEAADRIARLDVDALTPLDALVLLHEIRRDLGGR
jgi:DNA mismatch repair protein MutS